MKLSEEQMREAWEVARPKAIKRSKIARSLSKMFNKVDMNCYLKYTSVWFGINVYLDEMDERYGR